MGHILSSSLVVLPPRTHYRLWIGLLQVCLQGTKDVSQAKCGLPESLVPCPRVVALLEEETEAHTAITEAICVKNGREKADLWGGCWEVRLELHSYAVRPVVRESIRGRGQGLYPSLPTKQVNRTILCIFSRLEKTPHGSITRQVLPLI